MTADAEFRTEAEVREKLEAFDKWRGDPVQRRRCATARDRGVIETLCWMLGMTVSEWDETARGER